MGLQLSSRSFSFFLCKGITLAIFNFEGKIPLQSDWLIIKDKGSAISRDISFNKCVDIKSCPALFFGAKLCN